jgi:hypothetical protein
LDDGSNAKNQGNPPKKEKKEEEEKKKKLPKKDLNQSSMNRMHNWIGKDTKWYFSGKCHSSSKRRFWREKRSVEENCQKTHFKLKKGVCGFRLESVCCLLFVVAAGEKRNFQNH